MFSAKSAARERQTPEEKWCRTPRPGVQFHNRKVAKEQSLNLRLPINSSGIARMRLLRLHRQLATHKGEGLPDEFIERSSGPGLEAHNSAPKCSKMKHGGQR
jgi:hypothetical protein